MGNSIKSHETIVADEDSNNLSSSNHNRVNPEHIQLLASHSIPVADNSNRNFNIDNQSGPSSASAHQVNVFLSLCVCIWCTGRMSNFLSIFLCFVFFVQKLLTDAYTNVEDIENCLTNVAHGRLCLCNDGMREKRRAAEGSGGELM